jgi:hypothetical protein
MRAQGRICAIALAGMCQAALGDIGATAGKFSVTPIGTAVYTVPIVVPPGIAGLDPKIAIQFDSRAGNGYLGMRFRIAGLSQISRCHSNRSQDGISYDPVDFDTTDRFCLDGQRLVSDSYGGVGAEYRTELETFVQVISNGGTSFNPSYFTAKTKSGLTLTFGDYGSRSDARVTHPTEAGNPPFLWLLSRVQDPAGNYMEYRYIKDDALGEVVPDEIRYTMNDAMGYYQRLTIDDVVQKFAPPNENNTVAYQLFIEQTIGVPGETPLQDLDAIQLNSLMDAIQVFEGWREGTVLIYTGNQGP